MMANPRKGTVFAMPLAFLRRFARAMCQQDWLASLIVERLAHLNRGTGSYYPYGSLVHRGFAGDDFGRTK
jgi:hypothetical protein